MPEHAQAGPSRNVKAACGAVFTALRPCGTPPCSAVTQGALGGMRPRGAFIFRGAHQRPRWRARDELGLKELRAGVDSLKPTAPQGGRAEELFPSLLQFTKAAPPAACLPPPPSHWPTGAPRVRLREPALVPNGGSFTPTPRQKRWAPSLPVALCPPSSGRWASGSEQGREGPPMHEPPTRRTVSYLSNRERGSDSRWEANETVSLCGS